jgi:hypothetical protein
MNMKAEATVFAKKQAATSMKLAEEFRKLLIAKRNATP